MKALCGPQELLHGGFHAGGIRPGAWGRCTTRGAHAIAPGVVNETDGFTRRTQDTPPDVFLVKTGAYSE